MCFSAEADLLAGVVVGGVGADALRHVRHRAELPLAALPLLFGLHQVIEAITWWSLEDRLPEQLGTAATWAYLAIAFGVLPVLMPAAVLSVEPDPGRRRRLLPFAILGAAVATILMLQLVSGPVHAQVACRYIAYDAGLDYGGQTTALYVMATCGPLLFSGNRRFVLFGALNLAAVALLAWLLAEGIISLWCAWAAVTSVAIAAHLRAARRAEVVRAIAPP